MKYIIGIMVIFMFSCTKRVMEKDLEELQGSWLVERSFFSGDESRNWRRDEMRKGWKLEIRNDGTFTLDRLSDKIKGTYYTTRFQIHFNAKDDSGRVKEQLLWYDAVIYKRTMTTNEMENDGIHRMVWERPK